MVNNVTKIRMDDAIKKLRADGWLPRIAEHLGISRQATYQWDDVPTEHVLAISELTGIPPYELRPDIYPKKMFK